MKKIILSFIVGAVGIISIVGFSTYGVSAWDPPASPYGCYDSDNGWNVFTRGKLYTSQYPSGLQDYCYTFPYTGKTYVFEGLCSQDNTYYVRGQKNCAELGKFSCYMGQCVANTIQSFLADSKISAAVGTLTDEELDYLEKSYLQLELNNTTSWSEFDATTHFAYDDIRHIWLRRLALSFYLENTKQVPWSIKNYSQSDLNWLLSFCSDMVWPQNQQIEFPCGQYFRSSLQKPGMYFMFVIRDPNPLLTHALSKKIMYVDSSLTLTKPQDLIDSIILGMRKAGWHHAVSSTPDALEDPVFVQKIFDLKEGTSYKTSYFLSLMARSQNVPVRAAANNVLFGHGNAIFSSQGLGIFTGDDIYGAAKFLPVKEIYFSENQITGWFSKNVCQVNYEYSKISVERLLSYYTNPLYQHKIYQGLTGYCNMGPKYIQKLVEDHYSFHCDKGNGQCMDGKCAGKVIPALTIDEINVWNQKLSSYAAQQNICSSIVGLAGVPVPAKGSMTLKVQTTPSVQQVDLFIACENPPYSPAWMYVGTDTSEPFEFPFNGQVVYGKSTPIPYTFGACSKMLFRAESIDTTGTVLSAMIFGPYDYLGK